MAGPYGSAFTGGYKRSPLGEALAGAGQSIGQGLQAGTQNYVAGQENQEANKLRREGMDLEREKMISSKVDQINADYNAALLDGVDPVEAGKVRDRQITQIAGKTGLGRLNAVPEGPQTTPQPTAQPAAVPGAPAQTTAPERTRDFGELRSEARKKAEADKNFREARESLSNAGYEGYVGRVPSLPPPEALNTLEDVNDARGRISAWERDRQNKRAELQAAASQGNARASQLLAVMNAYDNDGEISTATTELNQANSALALAAQAERGDPTAQSSFRRVVAAMMNRGALSDADVRDVTGDSSLDTAKKTIDKWIGGDEMALTKGQIQSLKKILAVKRDGATARLSQRNEYFMGNVGKIVPGWQPPKPPAPTGNSGGFKIIKVEGK